MKICILETEHFEGAYPVIKLFDEGENNLFIFTNEDTYERFRQLLKTTAKKYQWFVQKSKASRFKFFISFYKQIKNYKPDILYLNTITNNHLLYACVLWMLPKTRYILTIHDINCMFESKLTWSLRGIIQHLGKKFLISQVYEFNVVADTMVDYMKTKAGSLKKVHNVPGAVFEDLVQDNRIKDSLHVVVPGSIDKRRRDYDQVFSLLHLAASKKINLHITLLGGFGDQYGSNIIERAKKNYSPYTRLTYYETDNVNQDEFDKQLNSAHFVLIPSVIHTTICGNISEIYGLTKSSGNIFDVIKHAKPFIVPAQLKIPANLESSCFKYSNLDELAVFFDRLLKNTDEYNGWQQKAFKNSKEYSIERISEKNPSLFGR